MPISFDFTYNVLTQSAQNTVQNIVAKARIPEYEPVSYFFTEANIPAQTLSSAAHGPFSSSKYNITSRFNLTNKKAYAVTEGQLLIVPQAGSDTKVNAILKPSKQAADTGVAIKYFVYRGLLKSSFINGDNIVAQGSANTPFIAKVWNDFLSYNFETPPASNPPLPASLLGYKPSEDGVTRIEPKFFNTYNESQPENSQNYNLPYVLAGQHFGTYADNQGGFEIVLDTATFYQDKSDTGFSLDINYAASANFILDTAVISGNANVSSKMFRQNIHQFLDPAAFYGAHITKKEKGQIKIGNNGAIYKTKAEIYTNIVTKFFNKNKVFLYIQGERGRHYNYDGTLGTQSIKIGNNSVPVAGSYLTTSWPIILLDFDQLHTANESDNNKNSNNLTFNLKYKTTLKQGLLYNVFGNNTNALIKDNFLTKDALIDPENLGTAIFTNDISYNINNTYGIDGSTALNVKNIAGYIYVIFEETKPDYLNDVFGPVNAEQMIDSGVLDNGEIITLETSRKNKLINRGNSILNCQQQVLFSGKIIAANGQQPASDNRARLYITKALSRTFADNDSEIFNWSNGGFANITNKEDYLKFVYGYDYEVWKGAFLDNGVAIRSLQLLNFKSHGNAENYLQLGIKETEYNKIRYNSETVPSNPATPHIPLNATNLTFCFKDRVVSNPTHFTKYTIGIKYDNPDGSTSEKYPSAAVYVYTLDEYYFFSKEFSEKFTYYNEFAPSTVSFRTKDNYFGEFGFDWLRTGNYSISKNSQIYPEHAYESILLGGYAKNTFNWFSNAETFSNGTEAFTALKKEYINIATQRDKVMYYVPYLNLFPLSEDTERPSVANLKMLIKNDTSVSAFELEYNTDLFIVEFITPPSLDIAPSQSEIQITCIEPFDDDQYIKINALIPDQNNVIVPKLAGIIKVCKNGTNHINEVKFALVRVKTKISVAQEKTGQFQLFEKVNLQSLLNQFYTKSIIDEVSFDLPLHNDMNFSSSGQFVSQGQYINYQHEQLQSYLREKLENHPGGDIYKNHFKIFSFDEETSPDSNGNSLGGNVDQIGIHSANLYKTRDSYTMAHEVLHGFGLGHSHRDNGFNIQTYQKFVYPNYMNFISTGTTTVPNSDVLKATDNLMSYNRDFRFALWKWQWEIMRKNIKNSK